MDDNARPVLMRLTVLSIGLSAGVAAWRSRSHVRRGLRLIGLWSYLAAVNGGQPNMQLVLEAEHAAGEGEMARPYWGYEEPWAAAQRREADAEPSLEPSAAFTSHSSVHSA